MNYSEYLPSFDLAAYWPLLAGIVFVGAITALAIYYVFRVLRSEPPRFFSILISACAAVFMGPLAAWLVKDMLPYLSLPAILGVLIFTVFFVYRRLLRTQDGEECSYGVTTAAVATHLVFSSVIASSVLPIVRAALT